MRYILFRGSAFDDFNDWAERQMLEIRVNFDS